MKREVYNTDEVMYKLWLHLVGDFRNVLGNDLARRPNDALLASGIKGFRGCSFPSRSTVSVPLFKADYQLENLFKRYRFRDDVFTDDELRERTLKKFRDTQIRIARPIEIDCGIYMVFQEARKIVRSILGEYTKEEHMKLCQFGKRACVGTSYRDSYLDVKLESSLTGSQEHIAWFNNYLATDKLLSDVVTSGGKYPPKYEVCDTLRLSLVPKSFKSFRGIMPDTLLGSFYTKGMGRLLQSRLLNVGLDIRHLQSRHRRLVKDNSVSRRLATADLSAASDSLTPELLRRLLPAKWYHAIMHGRINQCMVGDQLQQIISVATMGLGHTFPLQTLIFYSLLKAIGNLNGDRRMFVSVYGDDLIYPSRIHRLVSVIFPKLHLNLNLDKTYVEDHFRESCGADYYHGSDVRPFQPQGEFQLLDKRQFAAFLYKLLNGIKLRWTEEEIPRTLEYLLNELVLTQGIIFQVPSFYPDASGFKVDRPRNGYFYSPVFYVRDTQSCGFYYLHDCAEFRVVLNQSPYYWAKMSRCHTDDDTHLIRWDRPIDLPVLRKRKSHKSPKYVYSKLLGIRVRRMDTGTSSKTRSSIEKKVGSTSCWT